MICGINSWCIFSTSALAQLSMDTLRDRMLLIHGWSMMRNRSIKLSLWMNTAHLSLSSQLSDTLLNWSNINICYFNTLIALYLKLFTYNFWRSFYSQRFLRTSSFSIYWCSTHHRLTIFFRYIIVFSKKIKIISSPYIFIHQISVIWVCLLKCLIYFNRRHKLSFC